MIEDIAAFTEYWANARARTTRVLDRLPESELEWTHAPGRFTFGDLLRHLAGIERWMYAETVHGRPSRYPGHGRELADGRDEVLAYYDRLHEESLALLRALPEGRLTERCLTPAGTPITVWKWLRLHIEHEAHHRGQLYLMLGLRGVPTPPLYGLTEEDVLARSQRGDG